MIKYTSNRKTPLLATSTHELEHIKIVIQPKTLPGGWWEGVGNGV